MTGSGSMPDKKRRGFLKALWGLISLSLLTLLAANLRFLFPNVVSGKSKRFRLQKANDYPENSVDTRHKEEHKLFIIRDKKGVAAMRDYLYTAYQ